MKKTYLTIYLSICFYLNFSLAQQSVFDFELADYKKLPSLEFQIDEENISSAYLSKEILTSNLNYNSEEDFKLEELYKKEKPI